MRWPLVTGLNRRMAHRIGHETLPAPATQPPDPAPDRAYGRVPWTRRTRSIVPVLRLQWRPGLRGRRRWLDQLAHGGQEAAGLLEAAQWEHPVLPCQRSHRGR